MRTVLTKDIKKGSEFELTSDTTVSNPLILPAVWKSPSLPSTSASNPLTNSASCIGSAHMGPPS